MLICKVSGRSKNPGSFKTYLFSFKNGTRKSLKNENSNSTTGKYLDLRVKTMRTENILCNLNSNSSREKGDRNLKLSTTFSTCFSGLFIKKMLLQFLGNHWGTSENRTSCYGCGFQETFINCADISIGNLTESNQPEEKLSESVPTKSSHISKRTTDLSPHLLAGFNVSGDGEECKRCYAVPTWDHYPGMNDWCDTNCRKGNCPPCRCYCGCPARHFENL